MIKIIAVGNSFSQDATAYLDRICEAGNVNVFVRNLYIGGCPLDAHVNNISSGTLYEYQARGENTGIKVTLTEGLMLENWDVITFQQASHFSGMKNTYFPYIYTLSEYAKSLHPNAKQYVHETWAYEHEFSRDVFVNEYKNSQEFMYNKLKEAYSLAAASISAPIIPSGDVIQALRTKAPFDYKNGGLSLNRDGTHLSLDYGRYAAAATWYEIIPGGDIRANSFAPDGTDPELIKLIRETVHEVCHR